MTHLLKRILKLTGIAVGSVLLLVLVVVFGVLAYPQVIVNDHFMLVGSHFAERAGLHLSWSLEHVSIESPGLLRKRVHFDFQGLCVRMPSQGIDACFDKAQFAAAGGLVDFKPEVSEIGPVDLSGGRVVYTASDSEKAPAPAEKPSSKKGSLIPPFLAHAHLFPLHIDVPGWKFVSEETAVAGKFELQSATGEGGEGRIGLTVSAETDPGRQKATAKLDLENKKGFLTLDGWSLAAALEGKLPDGTDAHVRAKFDPRAGAGPLDYVYAVDAHYLKGRGRTDAHLKGELSPDRFSTTVSAVARGLVPELDRVWVNDCKVELARQGSETQPGHLQVNCPVQAQVPVPPHGFPPVALPARAGVKLVADLKANSFPPSADTSVDGSLGVELSPILTPIFSGGGKVQSRVAGVIKDFPRGWKLDTDLGLQLRIVNFQKLVHQLAGTPFDIWAPLRVVRGQVVVDVKGKFDANSGAAPLRLQTRLTSKEQMLDVDATGTLKLVHLHPTPQVHLSADVALSDIQLELPPLPALPSLSKAKIDPLPQFVPDGRFKKGPVRAPEPKQLAGREEPVFTYDVKIHTLDEAHPIRFLTPQIKAPIPLAVNVALSSDAPFDGQIKVLSFPLELFKRDVQLDHVTVTMVPPKDGAGAGTNQLDGRIVIPYTDYTISVLVLGTTDKPQVRFMSDPPLPDTQIIAVLIFGQSIDALDPEQQQSVGNTRAALFSGALSLGALYYLSSLSVEGVNYDPTSGVVMVRFRLAEGLSLNVSQGTEGQPSVGIRKRLSKHIAITTTLNNPSEQQTDRTISTFLEWAYQY